MNLKERLAALVRLGERLQESYTALEQTLLDAQRQNPWFTVSESRHRLQRIAEGLQPEVLSDWAGRYPALDDDRPVLTIALVPAGNLPAVGWDDILAIFLVGHRCQVRYSDKDRVLIPFLLGELARIEPRSADYFQPVERLEGFDRVIATGSNNTGLYFERYFGKYPHLLRGNRNSVAVLSGKEDQADLLRLSEDIFRYFGLGCRSVSKLYLPKDFDVPVLMETLDLRKDLMQHHKYKNNFDYNRSLYLLNRVEHWINDCLLLVPSPDLQSRIATVHVAFYESPEVVAAELRPLLDHALQCIVSDMPLSEDLPTVPLGMAQSPRPWDYADRIDTVAFLLE